MNKDDAKKYFRSTPLLEIELETLKMACKALENDAEFLIDYPEYLGTYYKDVNAMAWNNVLYLETSEPIKVLNKLRLINYLVFNSKNLDTYLSIVVDNGAPAAFVITKNYFEMISSLFGFSSKKYYFGNCKIGNKYVVFIIKK